MGDHRLRSPPNERKLVLKRPKRKAPQVVQEDEEEDDEVTEDGLVVLFLILLDNLGGLPLWPLKDQFLSVSYTHLTLPTNREV